VAACAAIKRALGVHGVDARQALAAAEAAGLVTYSPTRGLWAVAEAAAPAPATFTPHDPRGHAASARLENP